MESGEVPIKKEMLTEIVPNAKDATRNELMSMRKFCHEIFPNIENNINIPG